MLKHCLPAYLTTAATSPRPCATCPGTQCIFGGHKSDFDGHSKWSYDNLHLYASVYGDRCVEIGAQVLPLPGFADVYANNTCVLSPNAECLDLGQSANGFPAPGAEFAARFQWCK